MNDDHSHFVCFDMTTCISLNSNTLGIGQLLGTLMQEAGSDVTDDNRKLHKERWEEENCTYQLRSDKS